MGSPELGRRPPEERLGRKSLLSARSPQGSCRIKEDLASHRPNPFPGARVTGRGEGPYQGKSPRSLTLQHGATPTAALSSVRAAGRRGGGT